MLNNTISLLHKLHELELGDAEARLYVELLKGPNTHLRLSQATGINRTKVYRLIEQLERRSLVTRRADDRGTFLVASDTSTLEIELLARENKLKLQRASLNEVIPLLASLRADEVNTFAVLTYEGVEGIKQMQWHELKTKGELLVLGNVTVEQLVDSHGWAEKFRALTAEMGYATREIINAPYENPNFTHHQEFLKLYTSRTISREKLPIETPMVIYNDTVATYTPWGQKKVGVEIISTAFANTMRHVFEHYWSLSTST
jgi:sugar-specific transcriptional regulator TrmB